MLLLAVFLFAALSAVTVVVRSSMPRSSKALAIVVVFGFAAGAYFFTTDATFFSPFFMRKQQAFGAVDDLVNLTAAVAGVVGGIVGSVYFKGDKNLSLRAFLRPLCCAPLTLVPVLKLISGTDISVLGVATLVVTAYQAGFFWERLLKDTSPGQAK